MNTDSTNVEYEQDFIQSSVRLEETTTNISNLIAEQRNKRQEHNNIIDYDAINSNPKKPNKNNINDKSLERLLKYLNYNNLDEIIKDKNNHVENRMKLVSLYIAKNASRQGTKDENVQLENINTLQELKITILKDGKQKPIIGGGIRKYGKIVHSNYLKNYPSMVKEKLEKYLSMKYLIISI